MPVQVESWTIAIDLQSFSLLMSTDMFWMRNCKDCDSREGMVVKSMYGLSKVLWMASYSLASLVCR